MKSHDIRKAWLDERSDELYLSTKGKFKVDGLSGDGDDVIVCTPNDSDPITDCTFSLFWDGDDHGFGKEVIDAFALADVASQIQLRSNRYLKTEARTQACTLSQ